MISATRVRLAVLPSLLLLMSSCAAGPSTSQADDTPGGSSGPRSATPGICDASRAQFAVGRPVSQALVEEARVAAGAGVARVLLPDQPITLEYSAARLNLEVDRRGVVIAVRCG